MLQTGLQTLLDHNERGHRGRRHRTQCKQLLGLPVFTRDFARVYTRIPQQNLADTVIAAMHKAFTWQSYESKNLLDGLRAAVNYYYNGHAHAEFKAEGLSFDEPSEILTSICTEVYFQQDKTSRIYRQSGAHGWQGFCRDCQPVLLFYRITIHRR